MLLHFVLITMFTAGLLGFFLFWGAILCQLYLPTHHWGEVVPTTTTDDRVGGVHPHQVHHHPLPTPPHIVLHHPQARIQGYQAKKQNKTKQNFDKTNK